LPLLLCVLLLATNIGLVFRLRDMEENPTGDLPANTPFADNSQKGQITSDSSAESTSWKGWQSVRAAEDTRLYDRADEAGDRVGKVSADSLCAVTARENDWVYVRSMTSAGWARYSSFTPVGELYMAHEPEQIVPPQPLSVEHSARVDAIAEENNAVGLTLALIENGKVTRTHEYGLASIERSIPMTADTKIRIASISKVFTAMNAFAARDLGALTMEDDIGDILGYRVRNPRYEDTPITLNHLMTHTSSMYNIGYDNSIKQSLLSNSTYSNSAPGSESAWCYNNFGSGVIGAVTEKALDMTLLDFSGQYFLDRMGIDAAYHAKDIEAQDKIANLYVGSSLYRNVDAQLARVYPTTPGNSYAPYFGALTISAKDMASLITILINDGEYNGEYYISPLSVEEMEQTQLNLDGFDQCSILRRQTDMYGGRTLFYHTGNAQGVLSFACYDEQKKDGLVVIATGMNHERRDVKGIYSVCGDIADYCYNSVLGVQ